MERIVRWRDCVTGGAGLVFAAVAVVVDFFWRRVLMVSRGKREMSTVRPATAPAWNPIDKAKEKRISWALIKLESM